ncbi:MAG: flippase-like domain-containing protein [Chloroflexi bacterium]|nr:flippase-like domain-containing protein [Chloroflexota bacterium]
MSSYVQSRRFWLRLVQSGVSLSLIAWLLARVSWRDVLALMAQADVWLMVAACALYYLGVALSCVKWAIALRVESVNLPLLRLFRWYLIGAFVNNFFPTDVGGDLGRGFYAGRFSGRLGAVTRSIIVERLTGLVAMLVLAIFGMVVVIRQIQVEISAIAAGLGLLFIAALLVGRTRVQAHPWSVAAMDKLRMSWERYRSRPIEVLAMLALSLAFQTLAGTGVWLNMHAVGVDLPLVVIVPATALVGVVGLLPLSINGWGVRESLIVGLLAPLGALPDQLLAGALLGRVLLLLVTLAGGVLLLTEKPTMRSGTEKDVAV